MNGHLIAILGLSLTLVTGIFAFGTQIGALTERIETLNKQVELMGADLRAVNQGFIVWTMNHRDER